MAFPNTLDNISDLELTIRQIGVFTSISVLANILDYYEILPMELVDKINPDIKYITEVAISNIENEKKSFIPTIMETVNNAVENTSIVTNVNRDIKDRLDNDNNYIQKEAVVKDSVSVTETTINDKVVNKVLNTDMTGVLF